VLSLLLSLLVTFLKSFPQKKNQIKNRRRLPILATPKLTETTKNTKKERLVAYQPFTTKNRRRKEQNK